MKTGRNWQDAVISAYRYDPANPSPNCRAPQGRPGTTLPNQHGRTFSAQPLQTQPPQMSVPQRPQSSFIERLKMSNSSFSMSNTVELKQVLRLELIWDRSSEPPWISETYPSATSHERTVHGFYPIYGDGDWDAYGARQCTRENEGRCTASWSEDVVGSWCGTERFW